MLLLALGAWGSSTLIGKGELLIKQKEGVEEHHEQLHHLADNLFSSPSCSGTYKARTWPEEWAVGCKLFRTSAVLCIGLCAESFFCGCKLFWAPLGNKAGYKCLQILKFLWSWLFMYIYARIRFTIDVWILHIFGWSDNHNNKSKDAWMLGNGAHSLPWRTSLLHRAYMTIQHRAFLN